MKYDKVMLINPPYSGGRSKSVFCAGLGYIAESLEAAGVEYNVLDMSLGYSRRDLMRKLKMSRPGLVGISMMSYRYKETYGIIKNIKECVPGVNIAVGGPHISLFREEALEACGEIDYGIVLEGERAIIELCEGREQDSIKGLVFRRDGAVVYTGDRPFVEDPDSIPFPKYKRFELERSINRDITALPVVSSRGCPFGCIYCPVANSIGRRFRARSPENILKEISYWYEKGYRRFSFADDNFTLKRERVYNICEMIKKSSLKGLRLSCDNGVRADKIDRELLRLMKDAGFYRIAIGVEAGNDRILKNLGKKEDMAAIKSVIEDACGMGYETDLFFLVGSPGETLEDIEDSFKIATGYPIGIANFYNIIPFPHTELFDLIKETGRFLIRPEDYLNDYPILDNVPVFETPQLSEKERREVLKKAFKVTRMTMRRYWAKRLGKRGILGGLLAFVYTSGFVQNVVLRIGFLKRFVYRIAKIYFSL